LNLNVFINYIFTFRAADIPDAVNKLAHGAESTEVALKLCHAARQTGMSWLSIREE
jgi:hypothetical protein